MINVLHIVLGLQVGGLEKFVLDLIANYSPNIRPYIVCLEGKGELGERYVNLHIDELSKEPGISWKVLRQLTALIRQHKIDIIHTHNPSPHFYGAIAGFLTRRPIIHTKHGRNYPTEKKKVLLNRISSLLTDTVVAVSKDAAAVCLDIEKIPASKVTTILNGSDTTLFSPAQKVTDRNKSVRIGIVARLSSEKDHATLLHSAKILAGQTDRFQLAIIGGGSLQNSLEQLKDELGLAGYVSFLGMRHDIPELLRNLDIFVLSSTTEGISLTLLEAMASGLPIVATDVGGNPEVVVDGVTGYLVPPRDPAKMAEMLLKLVKDQQLRQQMGDKGRERVIQQFSITETARQYEDLYQTVLGRR